MRLIQVIGESVLFKKFVIRYLIIELLKQGYTLNKFSRKQIVISDTQSCIGKDCVVISKIKRSDDGEVINLSNKPVFIEWFEKLEGYKPKNIKEDIITNIDETYISVINIISTTSSYTHLLKGFIIDFATFQPLDSELIDFVTNYFDLLPKIMSDLLDGDITLSQYYATILNNHKKHLIKLANILIKSNNAYEFLLEYDLYSKLESGVKK